MNFNPNFYRQILLSVIVLISSACLAFNTQNFNAQNGIVNATVRKVYVDNTNRVWIGTENGVSMISSNGLKNIIFDQSWDNNQIWEIFQTPDSTIWFGCVNGSVYSYKNQKFSKFKNSNYFNQQIVRKFFFENNILYIGTDSGLYALDTKSNQLIHYKTDAKFNKVQIMNFFRFKNKLYCQSFAEGFFWIDNNLKILYKVKNEHWIHNAIFSSYKKDDTLLFSSQYISHDSKIQYKIYRTTGEIFENKKIVDSLVYNTLAWQFTQTKDKIFAACWGVHDPNGGLYEITMHQAIKRNDDYDITSDDIWDVNYDHYRDKLYVASLDKGLFEVDLNRIVSKVDMKVLNVTKLLNKNNSLYLLSEDKCSVFKNNELINSINIEDFDRFILNKKSGRLKFIENIPTTFFDIVDFKKQIALITNRGVLFVDDNLKPQFFYQRYGSYKVTKLSESDFMISTDYHISQHVRNFGKAEAIFFSPENKDNPVNVIGSCIINDSLTVYVSFSNYLYIYNQNKRFFTRLPKQDKIFMPCVIDMISSDNLILYLDKLNILYLGKLINNNFEYRKLIDLGNKGVVESYFLKSIEDNIFIGTNNGLYILSKKKLYLVNEYLGLPKSSILNDIEYHNGCYYISTSDGVFKFDFQKLLNLEFDYYLENLTFKLSDNTNHFKIGSALKFDDIPNGFVVNWELNRHPYPQNVEYFYKLNDDSQWNRVVNPGEIVLSNPEYGVNNLFLKIHDRTNGKIVNLKLAQLRINKPIYKSNFFITILSVIFVSFLYVIYYRKRIDKIRTDQLKTKNESLEIKEKLEIIQYLLKPHFIFNALTSIQNLIIEKDFDRSLKYSGYFAKLLRGVLDSSEYEQIPLNEELINLES